MGCSFESQWNSSESWCESLTVRITTQTLTEWDLLEWKSDFLTLYHTLRIIQRIQKQRMQKLILVCCYSSSGWLSSVQVRPKLLSGCKLLALSAYILFSEFVWVNLKLNLPTQAKPIISYFAYSQYMTRHVVCTWSAHSARLKQTNKQTRLVAGPSTRLFCWFC